MPTSKLLRREGGSQRTPKPIDPAWLASRPEAAIDPGRPIIDAHHHLFERPGIRYLTEEYLADLDCGHDIRASVFIDCGHGYDWDGPEAMAPVGEVRFAEAVARRFATARTQICAAIVSSADLTLGADVGPVLDAQIAASPRYRGIRVSAVWDPDESLGRMRYIIPRGLLLDPDFRAGFALLAPRQLSFEAWVYHPQLEDVTSLAAAFPDTTIVLNHIGGLIAGHGAYAARFDEEVAAWKQAMARLSRHRNVVVKLGGLAGVTEAGFTFHQQPVAPSSEELAKAWRPYLEPCIQWFGPDRCMFESNFPPDRRSTGPTNLWNAFKRLAAPYSEAERHDMFFGTAERTYRLTI